MISSTNGKDELKKEVSFLLPPPALVAGAEIYYL
jgi:hypothetical protein